jgi:hypothetical protein
MNRKLAVFLYFAVSVSAAWAQAPKEQSNEEKVTSLQEARKLLALSLADTFARSTETLQSSLAGRSSRNSLQIASGIPNPGLLNPNSIGSNIEQKAQAEKRLAGINYGNAESYSNFLREQSQSYQRRLEATRYDSIPDVFQYQLRSDIYWRLGMIKSAESLNDVGGNINLVWLTDATEQRVLAFPVQSLRSNPRYGAVDNYREGFARVKKNQVYGFMTIAGAEAIPCQYEQAEPFNDGRALVKKYDWHFVNVNGEESESLGDVESAKALRWGFSLVKLKVPAATKKVAVAQVAIIDNSYDKTRKPVSDTYEDIVPFGNTDLFLVKVNKKFGLIRIDGKLRTEIIYDRIEVLNFRGLAKVEVDKKYGIIDSTGAIKLPAVYQEISEVNPLGVTTLRSEEGVFLLRLEGFKMSRAYLSVSAFDARNTAIVQDKNRRFGMINSLLQEVITPGFSSFGAFNQYELAPVCREEGKCGFIDRNGTEAIPTRYKEVERFNNYGYVVVRQVIEDCRKTGKANPCVTDLVCDLGGNVIIGNDDTSPDRYRYQLTDTLLSTFLVVRVSQNSSYEGSDVKRTLFHLVSRGQKRNITPIPYESLKGYDRHLLFTVRRDGKWGLIDTTGKVIVKCIYNEIMMPREGLYAVKFDNNKYGFIDPNGKLRINYEYDEVKAFKNGLAIVSKGANRMGLINMFNAKIAPCSFKNVEYLDMDKLELTDSRGEKYVINVSGECQSNCTKFEEILRKANQEESTPK